MEKVESMVKGKKVRMSFVFSEQEKSMLNEICDKFGCNQSEFLRGLLRDKYAKHFPAYMDRKLKVRPFKEPELTPEQRCEQLGGTVERRDGAMFCVFKREGKFGTNEYSDLLENINKKSKNPFD